MPKMPKAEWFFYGNGIMCAGFNPDGGHTGACSQPGEFGPNDPGCGHEPPVFYVGEEHSLSIPPGVNEALARYGGSNLFGEPRLRCVWSGNRLEVVIGEWLEWDGKTVEWEARGRAIVNKAKKRVHELRRVPKYEYQHERFIIEEWMPPEEYGDPELWSPILGEFPWRGDYEAIKVCESCKFDCVRGDTCENKGHERTMFVPDAEWARRFAIGYRAMRAAENRWGIRNQRQHERAVRTQRHKQETRDKIASLRPAFSLRPWAQVQGGRDEFPAA